MKAPLQNPNVKQTAEFRSVAPALLRRAPTSSPASCMPGAPRVGHDFSRIDVHADGRFSAPPSESAFVDQRPPSDDPIHQPLIDQFRQEQGFSPTGTDESGAPSGPSEAQIKYGPRPIGVLNGPFHAPVATPTHVGMQIAIAVNYTGRNADLAQVQDSEQVSLSFAHTGSFAGMPPIPSSQTGFMPAANIPNDRHLALRNLLTDRADNHGGAGSVSKHQLDIYAHAQQGVLNPVAIPNSGYLVRRSIRVGPGTRVSLLTEKEPAACTVNGFTTAAGPSPAQSDDVEVRP